MSSFVSNANTTMSSTTSTTLQEQREYLEKNLFNIVSVWEEGVRDYESYKKGFYTSFEDFIKNKYPSVYAFYKKNNIKISRISNVFDEFSKLSNEDCEILEKTIGFTKCIRNPLFLVASENTNSFTYSYLEITRLLRKEKQGLQKQKKAVEICKQTIENIDERIKSRDKFKKELDEARQNVNSDNKKKLKQLESKYSKIEKDADIEHLQRLLKTSEDKLSTFEKEKMIKTKAWEDVLERNPDLKNAIDATIIKHKQKGDEKCKAGKKYEEVVALHIKNLLKKTKQFSTNEYVDHMICLTKIPTGQWVDDKFKTCAKIETQTDTKTTKQHINFPDIDVAFGTMKENVITFNGLIQVKSSPGDAELMFKQSKQVNMYLNYEGHKGISELNAELILEKYPDVKKVVIDPKCLFLNIASKRGTERDNILYNSREREMICFCLGTQCVQYSTSKKSEMIPSLKDLNDMLEENNVIIHSLLENTIKYDDETGEFDIPESLNL